MSGHLSDELLSAHLDGALDDVELTAVEAHLHDCGECRRRLDLLRATSRAVAGLPDEEPGPLDLSFLAPAPSNVVNLPSSSRWRPPNWAAPMLAAAAVLVVAVGAGSLALRHPTGSSGSSTALGQPQTTSKQADSATHGSLAQGGGGSSFGAGAPAADGVGGAPAGTAGGTTANQQPARSALTGPTFGSSETFAANGGATLTVSATASSVHRGQEVQVSMALRAGSTTIDASALQVVVRRSNSSAVLLGSGATSVPPGHSASIYGTWVAGQLGGNAPVAGDYSLEAHVLLADGTDLTVNMTIHVT